VNSRWTRAATVLGTALLLGPPIAGLLSFTMRLGLGWLPSGDGTTDLFGLAGTHVLLSYLFGSIPALASGLILSILVWHRGKLSARSVTAVAAICTLAYCLAVAVLLRGELVRVMSPGLAFNLTCLAVVTASIVRAMLKWARFI
jgi:hypothetical protein